ncbi:hypothetical protein [Candidatus Chloroploca asiatica]|uniref:Uncharacterized protein n=1 Tax=Candidatus Chloroploca asiatica TaxID=1506545 RepID=A0A2H3L6W4_9CHLR|nr:hypothetical protein [Candidatus Chloroploca asiatica]PDV98975.1 hypothetical protein A9Q02_14080 [Candidatus Chloroploca asiatica]
MAAKLKLNWDEFAGLPTSNRPRWVRQAFILRLATHEAINGIRNIQPRTQHRERASRDLRMAPGSSHIVGDAAQFI